MLKQNKVYTISPAKTSKNQKFAIANKEKEVIDIQNEIFGQSRSPISKLILVFVVLGCIVACFYQIGQRVRAFSEGLVVLEIELKQRTRVSFPSITVCGLKLVLIFLDQKVTKINGVEIPNLYGIISDLNIGKAQDIWDREIINPQQFHTTMMCPNTLNKACYIERTELTYASVPTLYGNCTMITTKNTYEFKGEETMIQYYWLNPIGHLKVAFFLHDDTFHHTHESLMLIKYAYADNFEKFYVYSRELQNLNTPRNPCMPKEVANTCIDNCIDAELSKLLTCGLPFIKSSLPQCSTIAEMKENYLTIYPILRNQTKYYDKCQCKRKCNEIQYTLHKDQGSKFKFGETMMQFRYPHKKDEILREKELMTAITLFSEIGGTLGLYLGISLVTIIEFIETGIRYLIARKK